MFLEVSTRTAEALGIHSWRRPRRTRELSTMDSGYPGRSLQAQLRMINERSTPKSMPMLGRFFTLSGKVGGAREAQ
jgi:hypothetical protein